MTDAKRFKIQPQIREITATVDSSNSIDTDFKQKTLYWHLNFRKCTLTVEYIAVLRVATRDPLWKQNGGNDSDCRKIHCFKLIIYAQTALIWKFYGGVCNATLNFDKCRYIRCLCVAFAAKHTKAPLSLTARWWIEPDFGSWQSPDISRSHLYRGTIAWTPPTAIYQEYTVFVYHKRGQLYMQLLCNDKIICFIQGKHNVTSHW